MARAAAAGSTGTGLQYNTVFFSHVLPAGLYRIIICDRTSLAIKPVDIVKTRYQCLPVLMTTPVVVSLQLLVCIVAPVLPVLKTVPVVYHCYV